MSATRVAVVGAGIAGLSCACTLRQEAARLGIPLDLTVLEAGPAAGGHVRTIAEDGFIVEGGPNGFLDRSPDARELVRSLGLEARLVDARPETRRRFIVRRSRLCEVPRSLGTLVTSGALSWSGKLRLAWEPFAPAPPPGVEETVFAFARRRIGHEAAETLVDTAVSGISAGDSHLLSARAQFPVMVAMEGEHGSLLRAAIARRHGGRTSARLRSFDRGMATITRALLLRLDDALRLGSQVQRLRPLAGGWRLELGAGRTLAADRVVLAVPAHAASTLVSGFDPALSSELRTTPYGGLAVVALAYRRCEMAHPLNGYGYLVPRAERLATLGVVWESSLFDGRAPADMVLLRVFLGGTRSPGIVDEEEAALVSRARRELAQVMRVSAQPVREWVFRWPRAIAQYTVGHLTRVSAIRERASQHDGLTVCGTAYDGVAFAEAIASGRRAALALAKRLPAYARSARGRDDRAPLEASS